MKKLSTNLYVGKGPYTIFLLLKRSNILLHLQIQTLEVTSS